MTKEYIRKLLVENVLPNDPTLTEEIIDTYFTNLDEVFANIREFEDGKDVMKALDGPVCQAGFKRLN